MLLPGWDYVNSRGLSALLALSLALLCREEWKVWCKNLRSQLVRCALLNEPGNLLLTASLSRMMSHISTQYMNNGTCCNTDCFLQVQEVLCFIISEVFIASDTFLNTSFWTVPFLRVLSSLHCLVTAWRLLCTPESRPFPKVSTKWDCKLWISLLEFAEKHPVTRAVASPQLANFWSGG